MGLFDKLRSKIQEDTACMQQAPNPSAAASIDVNTDSRNMNSSSEGYYFEKLTEFLLYISTIKPQHDVIWRSGDCYIKEIERGYQLIEQKKYKEAIEVLKACLQLNPIGLRARFEMCEAYIMQHDMVAAQKTLMDMTNYLVDKRDIARFYRRLGYIKTERRNYEVAVACYQYSKQFEDHSLVAKELMYITSISGRNVLPSDAKAVLQVNKIPILSEKKLEGASTNL